MKKQYSIEFNQTELIRMKKQCSIEFDQTELIYFCKLIQINGKHSIKSEIFNSANKIKSDWLITIIQSFFDGKYQYEIFNPVKSIFV